MAQPKVVISIVVVDRGSHWEVQGHCECHDGRVDIDALRMAARWLREEADNAIPAG